jgi:hypothetical protein
MTHSDPSRTIILANANVGCGITKWTFDPIAAAHTDLLVLRPLDFASANHPYRWLCSRKKWISWRIDTSLPTGVVSLVV